MGAKGLAIVGCITVLAPVLALPASQAPFSGARRQIKHQPALIVNAAAVREQPDSALLTVVPPPSESFAVLARLCLTQPLISRSRTGTYRLGLRSPPVLTSRAYRES